MNIVALPPDITPTIVCPDWCTIPTEEHLADLPSWEGSVIHHSATVKVSGRFHVSNSRPSYPDGTPQPDPHGPADVVSARDDAQIERFDTLEVEGFTFSDSDSSRGATRHFERVPDLGMKVRKALKDSGDEQAVLVLTLGIDDHDSHLVQSTTGPATTARARSASCARRSRRSR